VSTSFKSGDIVHYDKQSMYGPDHNWEVLLVVEVPDEVNGNCTKSGGTMVYLIPEASSRDYTPGERYGSVSLRLGITDGVDGWSLVRPDVIVYVNLWDNPQDGCGVMAGTPFGTLEAAITRTASLVSSGQKLATLKINKTQCTVEVIK